MSEKYDIKPSVFKWLREDSGYTIDEVAKILTVNPELIKKWEEIRGKEKIQLSYKQIKSLAKLYDVQVACFFLPKPPEGKMPPLLRRGIMMSTPRSLRKSIRKARYLQSVIYEIDNELKEKIKNISHYKIEDDPEKCSAKERQLKDVKEVIRLTNAEKLLSCLREILAKKMGIYTFIFNGMPLDEVRGFSFVDKIPYIIVINSEDSINGKIFTLLHEYAHILLRNHSICVEMEKVGAIEKSKEAKIEHWCNIFAASFLLPAEKLKEQIEVKLKEQIGEEEIVRLLHILSEKFNTSKYATAIRLLTVRDNEFQTIKGFRYIQQELEQIIDKLREEAKKEMHKRDEERYLFTWEDVTDGGIEVPAKLSNMLKINRKEDMLMKKVREDKVVITVITENKVIAEITIEEDTAILKTEDKELELEIKREDNRTKIYKPFYMSKISRRKYQLGSYFIDKVTDAYSQHIINTYDLLDYLQIKTNDLERFVKSK